MINDFENIILRDFSPEFLDCFFAHEFEQADIEFCAWCAS